RGTPPDATVEARSARILLLLPLELWVACFQLFLDPPEVLQLLLAVFVLLALVLAVSQDAGSDRVHVPGLFGDLSWLAARLADFQGRRGQQQKEEEAHGDDGSPAAEANVAGQRGQKGAHGMLSCAVCGWMWMTSPARRPGAWAVGVSRPYC